MQCIALATISIGKAIVVGMQIATVFIPANYLQYCDTGYPEIDNTELQEYTFKPLNNARAL